MIKMVNLLMLCHDQCDHAWGTAMLKQRWEQTTWWDIWYVGARKWMNDYDICEPIHFSITLQRASNCFPLSTKTSYPTCTITSKLTHDPSINFKILHTTNSIFLSFLQPEKPGLHFHSWPQIMSFKVEVIINFLCWQLVLFFSVGSSF